MSRNHSIDTIRGTLLLTMSINHFIWITVGWANIQYITSQPFGPVSAAEGFILISGLMVGLIYSVYDRQVTRQKLFRRAKQLYFYHMAAIAGLLTIASLQIALEPSIQTFYNKIFPGLIENKLLAVAASATLIHKPAYFDILPMYIVFLLLAPLVLSQLQNGRSTQVLIVSVLLWLSSRVINLSEWLTPYFPDSELNTGYFSLLAWQLIFVIGITLGYYAKHQPINWFKYRSVTVAVAIIATIIFFLHRNVLAEYGIHYGTLYELADKPLIGWLRAFNLMLLVYLFSWLLHCKPNALAFKPLALLGRYSLHVFTWHYVVIFALAPFALGHFSFQPNFNLCLVAVALLLFVPPLIKQRQQQLNTLSLTRSS
ncbi:OpgC domain-containing protein [Vibrio sinaloensis]|uniref:OpgC domain-containing protein n=1 Tax=Photobacterium sp. (strain ATCC 43367) TaxID=379097 RepID=UPI00058089CE|nr:OpgC domain-containing protein [Vibrio sinaloensis]KHT42512.1 hypothetical protein RJ46_17220 [Vibrio sinaloensis]